MIGKWKNSKGKDHVQGHSPTATSASSSHPAKKADIPLILENSNGRTSSQSAQSIRLAVVDLEVIQNLKLAATQLKVMPKARVSFASARTTIPNLKPFVLLDPASIRRGFQEGGASTKKEDLKKGMYYVMLSYGLDNSVGNMIGEQVQLLSQRRFNFFHFLELPSTNLCLTRPKSLSLTVR